MSEDGGAGGQLHVLLLSALAAVGEAHGYVLLGALRNRSEGVLELAEGSVYPALQRLELARLVSGRWDESGRRPRRIYRLNAAGRGALEAKRTDWQGFAASVNRVIRWAT